MILTIRYQNGTSRQWPLRGGWNYLTGSFGVHILDNGNGYTARISNGAVGIEPPGGFFFAQISIQLDSMEEPHILPRAAHFKAWGDGPEMVGFGTGFDYFPPNAVKILRWTQHDSAASLYLRRPRVRKHPLLALPQSLAGVRPQYAARADNVANVLAFQFSGAGITHNFGTWAPIGDYAPGAQGGDGINPYPGWEGSSKYHLLMHDLTMERMPIDYRDALTGKALRQADQPEYRATRGWSAVATHAEFVQRDTTTTNADARVPRDVNEGACAYRADLLQAFAYDDQHLVRALAFAKPAAILWGDKCAALDLEMMAADAWMGRDQKALGSAPNVGSALGRGSAWTLAAMNASDALGGMWDRQISEMVRMANRAQMPTGAWFRAESKDEDSLGFAPSPWRDRGMPRNVGAAQTMETTFLACALYDAGEMAGAGLAFDGLMRSPVGVAKWMGVAIDAVPTPDYHDPVPDPENFWLWPLAGLVGSKAQMATMQTPDHGVAGPDTLHALIADRQYGATAKPIETLER